MRVTAFCLLGLAIGLAAAEEPARVGLPWDWSHNAIHLRPLLPAEALARGEYDAWLHNWQHDPRFRAQVVRKADAYYAEQSEWSEPATAQAKAAGGQGNGNGHGHTQPGTDPITRDWSNVMGGAAGTGLAGTYPAKYSFDINATPSCANDFVVFPTDSPGATGSGTFASRTGTFPADPGAGMTVTITNATRTLTLTSSTSANTGLNFQSGLGVNTTAQNLSDAINRNGGTVGVSASASNASVTITSGTHGASAITVVASVANYWGLGELANTTEPLPGGSGTAGQPTIIAFNNLYKTTCGGVSGPTPVPTTFWSYNTGTGESAETSPVISLDGTQVLFVVSNGTTAAMVFLKWSSTVSVGTVGNPTTPTLAASGAAYRTCTAPCMFKIVAPSNANDTNSSPFVDYTNDVAYFGTADGRLLKFTGVFLGSPAPAGAPWPVTVSSGNALSSPVFDFGSGLVFVGSGAGASSGGQLHSVDASGNALSSIRLAAFGSTGVGDSPFVDSFAQRVYAYVAEDTTTACTGNSPCEAVYQFQTTTALNTQTTPPSDQLGANADPARFLRAGAFDGAYWSSANAASPTGNLYVCGSANKAGGKVPTLYKLPITANALGASVAATVGLTGNSAASECAPMIEMKNGANDYLFVSVPANGNLAGCSGSCMYMFNLTATGFIWGTTPPAAGLQTQGGTTGIIVDNISSATGASQIYFSNLANPGNAVQASQAGLQ